ncbi:AAA family ATPase [Geodermatophilus nigrescens]
MSADHASVIADEQARNQRYLRWLAAKARVTIPIAVPRSSRWTHTVRPQLNRPTVQPVIGRVGLAKPHDVLGTDSFYIGPWRWSDGEVQVVSWAAPIADAYYGHGEYVDLAGAVQVTRAFEHRVNDIVDFGDERHDGCVGSTAFDRRVPLRISRPPGRSSSADVRTSPPRQVPVVSAPAQEAAEQPSRPAKRPAQDAAALRHAQTLRKTLQAPRTAALRQVLSTLQPRQHALVKWDPKHPLVVQGHPGAGKTIVAVHRAAYLAHEEGHGRVLSGRILLLGPTNNYVAHTAKALGSLTEPTSVQLTSTHELLRSLLPNLATDPKPGDEEYRDYDEELAGFVERIATKLFERRVLLSTTTPAAGARSIYDTMRKNASTAPGDWKRYLSGLPEWESALQMERFAPLLTYCALLVRPAAPVGYRHIIVDEAQDIRPMEWRILRVLNDGRGWTLVGDMNQRRSDWCYGSWDLVTATIGVDDAAHVEDYRSVYRSTSAIQQLAGRLLHSRERTGIAVQADGERPVVIKTTAAQLSNELVASVSSLVGLHVEGTVAAIAVEASSLRSAFARQGWRATKAGGDTYEKKGRTIRLLSAVEARGLEFDAVVVVEPADFPMNLGRHGLLYTSLTRANRTLVVLHSKPLPEDLRRAAR